MKINTKLEGDVTMDTVPHLIATSRRVAGEFAAELDSGRENHSFLFSSQQKLKENQLILESWKGSVPGIPAQFCSGHVYFSVHSLNLWVLFFFFFFFWTREKHSRWLLLVALTDAQILLSDCSSGLFCHQILKRLMSPGFS